MPNSRLSHVTSYFASKLASAGFVFIIFLVIVGKFDIYQMSIITQELSLWYFIYGYAVLFSAGVDAVFYKHKNEHSKKVLIVLCYVLGGYIPFLFVFNGQWIYGLIAGGYGVACALVFLFANSLFKGLWPYNAIWAVSLLAVSILVSILR